MRPLLFTDDPQFWYETQRALGHSAYGGAEVGEVLATAARITAGDYDSWHDEWTATADRVAAEAEEAARRGHHTTAASGLLRASNYYRSAEFFLHGNPADPRIDAAYDRSVATFRHALRMQGADVEPVTIPYEGTVLHGYFYRAATASGADDGPRPTVVMHNGFDGTAEELHFFGAAAAVERGYHVLTFDGPGQPAALRRDGLVFRADWQHVVTPVLDWLLTTRAEVDPERVALLGISMGGLLAPRAAADEHRLAACIAVDGVYDLGIIATREMPMPREQAEELLRAPDMPEIDAALDAMMAQDPTARWAMTHGMYVTGTPTPRAFLARYLDFSLADGVAERITCPTLVCEAEEDLFFAGQPELLFEHLTAPRSALLRFTADEGAGAHCHSGTQRLAFGRIYDWLDEVLAAA
ncbi:dipeptidyl aminopeptidase [Actinomycetota bacterium]|nr:dipeptidyl aminopeptidase [Actinomycetota bacterium]